MMRFLDYVLMHRKVHFRYEVNDDLEAYKGRLKSFNFYRRITPQLDFEKASGKRSLNIRLYIAYLVSFISLERIKEGQTVVKGYGVPSWGVQVNVLAFALLFTIGPLLSYTRFTTLTLIYAIAIWFLIVFTALVRFPAILYSQQEKLVDDLRTCLDFG